MRKLALFALPLSLAIFGAVYLLPQALWLPAAVFCGLVGLGYFLLRRSRGEVALRVLLIALGLAAGLLWCRGYEALRLAPARMLDEAARISTATVLDFPQESTYGTALTAELHLADAPKLKAWLKIRGDHMDLRPGDEIRFDGTFALADEIAGQPSFYFFSDGIFLQGYADGLLSSHSPEQIPLRFLPRYAARAIAQSVTACFPQDVAGFMSALLTGDKSALDPLLYGAMQRTGIAHVVAVSGLHVSFFAGLLALLFSQRRRLGAGIIILLLFFFAAVAGNSPSVLRAVYLQAALLLAPLFGRENDRLTSLSAILMLLLLWNPYAAASVSLQLSFAAVAGIYLITAPLYARWTAGLGKGGALYLRLGRGALRFVAASLATTLGALIFTTPLMALYFGMVSLVAPLANLLTLWAVSDGFMGGLIAALVHFICPPLGRALALLVSMLIRYVQHLATWLAAFPFAALPMEGMYLRLWFCGSYVILILYLLWRGEKKRPLLPLCACALTLCAALLFTAAPQAPGNLAVSVLDVGQGQSILLTSGKARVLVDCGGSGGRSAGDIAATEVQKSGSNHLDLLVLTHYHADHANGVATLMARLDIAAVALPDVEPEEPLRAEILALAQAEGAELIFVRENTHVTLGDAELTLYAPLGDGGANEEGLSILATAGSFDALMTGDMNAAVEKRLVKYGNLPDIELLVAGHHGSAHASSEALLMATRPECAVISVGYNSYGHPADAALERLAAAGCAIYRTDEMGSVKVTSGGD